MNKELCNNLFYDNFPAWACFAISKDRKMTIRDNLVWQDYMMRKGKVDLTDLSVLNAIKDYYDRTAIPLSCLNASDLLKLIYKLNICPDWFRLDRFFRQECEIELIRRLREQAPKISSVFLDTYCPEWGFRSSQWHAFVDDYRGGRIVEPWRGPEFMEDEALLELVKHHPLDTVGRDWIALIQSDKDYDIHFQTPVVKVELDSWSLDKHQEEPLQNFVCRAQFEYEVSPLPDNRIIFLPETQTIDAILPTTTQKIQFGFSTQVYWYITFPTVNASISYTLRQTPCPRGSMVVGRAQAPIGEHFSKPCTLDLDTLLQYANEENFYSRRGQLQFDLIYYNTNWEAVHEYGRAKHRKRLDEDMQRRNASRDRAHESRIVEYAREMTQKSNFGLFTVSFSPSTMASLSELMLCMAIRVNVRDVENIIALLYQVGIMYSNCREAKADFYFVEGQGVCKQEKFIKQTLREVIMKPFYSDFCRAMTIGDVPIAIFSRGQAAFLARGGSSLKTKFYAAVNVPDLGVSCYVTDDVMPFIKTSKCNEIDIEQGVLKLQSNLMSLPSTVEAERVVGHKCVTVIRTHYPHGLDWSKWTVFRLDLSSKNGKYLARKHVATAISWLVIFSKHFFSYRPITMSKNLVVSRNGINLLMEPSEYEMGSLETTEIPPH